MNILVITYWKFSDALIQTYTLPYLRIIRNILPAGSGITLITLEPEGEVKQEIPVEQGITRFSFRYYPFGWRAALAWNSNFSVLRNMVRSKNIKAVHTFCTPAGWPGSAIARQMKLPLILDSFEPHAEPMVETGTWKRGGIAHLALSRIERKQVKQAQWIIGVVAAMKAYAQRHYNYSGSHFLVKPACIDFSQFNLLKRKNPALKEQLGLTDEIICVYAGKFGGLYMREEAFRFFRMAHEVFGEKFKVLLLSSTPQEEINAMAGAAGLDPSALITMFVPHAQVPDYMGLADFAFSAFKPVESRKYCTPIKNGEYWAMGLPVVIGEGISEDSDIIRNNDAGYVLKSLSDEEFRAAAVHIRQLLRSEDRNNLANRIHELAQIHRNFAIAENVYRTIYGSL
jgi:hypothetical protein